jgi:TonB family protein
LIARAARRLGVGRVGLALAFAFTLPLAFAAAAPGRAFAQAVTDQTKKGVLTKPPTLVKFVQAAYPPEEKEAGRTASVVLALTIAPDGKVEDAAISESGGAAFDRAAIDAARAFVFEPAEVDGQNARVRILYKYEFTLEKEVPTTAEYDGVVRDRVTRKPIAGVTVALDDGKSATTDASGKFHFEGVAPGVHKVTLTQPGKAPLQTEEAFEAGRRVDASYDVDVGPAEATPDGEPAEDMEIVVTAPPLTKDVTSVEVGGDEARRVPGAQGDVLKVVQSLPGVNRAAAGSGALVVWGAAPEDTRVYVEGVRIPLLYHIGGVRSVVSSDLVRSVELVPGGYGAAYGRGLGGIVTVKLVPLDDPAAHGSVSLDLLDAAASMRTPIASGDASPVRAAVAARYGWAHRLLPVVTDEDVGELYPVPRYMDGQTRVQLRTSNRSTLEVGAMGSIDEVERVVASTDPASRKSDERNIRWGRLYARVDATLEDGTALSITPWFGADELESAQKFGAVATDVATDSTIFGLRATASSRVLPESPGALAGLVVTGGLDGEATAASVVRNGSTSAPPREGDVRVFGQAPSAEIGADTWETWSGSPAVFGEGDLALFGGRVHVVGGVRLDPYLRSASRQTPAVGDTPSIGLFEQEVFVEPRAAVRARIVEDVEVRAAVGLYHQPPPAEDVSAVFGSPTLESSSARHFLGGVNAKLFWGLDVDLVGYFTSSSDLPVRSPFESPRLAQSLVSTGVGRSYGMQVLLRRQLEDGLFGWISYGLARSERAATEDADHRLFDFDQTHVFTALASYEIGLGFEVGSRFRLSSGFPRTRVTGAYYVARTDAYEPLFGDHNDDRLPTFVQLDVRFSKKFDLGKVDIEAYLDVQNVTNHENVEENVYSDDYSESGAITGVPILPVVGLRSSW